MEEKDDYYNHDKNVDVNRCSDVVKRTGLLVLLLKAQIMRETADKFQLQLIPQHRELVFLCHLWHTAWLGGSAWLHTTPVLLVCPRVLLSPISWGFHYNGSSTFTHGFPGPYPASRSGVSVTTHWFCPSVSALMFSMAFLFGVKDYLTCFLIFILQETTVRDFEYLKDCGTF